MPTDISAEIRARSILLRATVDGSMFSTTGGKRGKAGRNKMASRSIYGTTTGTGTVDTVTLTSVFRSVEIINLGVGLIYARTDGVAPSVAGADSYVVPANSALTLPVDANLSWEQGSGTPAPVNTVVKLVSAGALAYGVSGQG